MKVAQALDPVDIAIAWDRLISIADEGAATLIRTSFSTLVREALDLSVMLFDNVGRMIVQSTKCIPVFIGTSIGYLLMTIPLGIFIDQVEARRAVAAR